MIRAYSYHKFIILFFIFIVQLFAPRIDVLEASVSIDVFLIYLTYLSTHNSRWLLVLLGFSFGLAQDIITQCELLGLFALTKTITGFILGSLNSYNKIWSKNIKMAILFLTYLFHFHSIQTQT